MKLPLSWVREYLDFQQSSDEIAHALTLAGLEVEGIDEVGGDVIFDIGLTPNLGHCMSIVGIARELSAILSLPLKEKHIAFDEGKDATEDLISVSIEDNEACLRYSCRLVKGVKVGPSPEWLVNKLEACGLRTRNNVVDIGNLVMLELGQPLHLFDYDHLEGREIIVRSASNDGFMDTLDEEERTIPDEVLLICDAKKPVAFAGVMGELSSSVSEKSTNVLIEAAHFTPEAVRKTSKLLNLRTDSSARFERGIDPLATEKALDFAAQLLSDVAGGEICKGAANVSVKEFAPHILDVSPKQANRILGTQLSIGEMVGLLQRLEIKVLSESDNALKVQVPSYRNDLRAEIDLIEEIGRMFGFNNIPRGHARHVSSKITHAPLFLFEEEIRTKLVGQGLQECLTCDLISPKLAAITMENALGKDAQIHVLHPASVDQSILRTSLLPGLLETVKFNCDRQNLNMALFEVGHIHFKDKESFFQEPAAGILLTGKEFPFHFANKPEDVDFFDLKGHMENLLLSLGFNAMEFVVSHLHNFHPGRQAKVKIGDLFVGAVGEVHPKHLRTLGIGQRVFYAELNLHDLMNLKKDMLRMQALPAFPGSERDWTISLLDMVPINAILGEIKSLSSPLLESVFLLDLYKSDKIGKDRKNATFRFRYRDPKKTIEYQEVENEHKRLIKHLAEKLKDSVP